MLHIALHQVGRFIPPKYSPNCWIEHIRRDTPLWEFYNEIAERGDLKRADDWNALADAMLLFVRRTSLCMK